MSKSSAARRKNRGIARSTGFLSDREQALAAAATNRAQCGCGRFWGGWPGAERRVLCLEPPGAWAPEPVAALRIAAKGEPLPGHRDLLGAMLGLGIERVCVGDILPDAQDPAVFYAFVLEEKADFLAAELTQGRARRRVRSALRRRAGACARRRRSARCEKRRCPACAPDAVLGAMMNTSRALAAQAIAAGKVEVNHLPLRTAHDACL